MALKSPPDFLSSSSDALSQSFSSIQVFQWLYSMQIKYQKMFMGFDSITLRS